MSSWSPTTYKTRSLPSYKTALKQRGSLSIWFDPEMEWHPPATGKCGRQPEFSEAAIQVCLTMKVLFWHPPSPGDRVCRKSAASGRARLESAGLQHSVPPPEGIECRHSAARQSGWESYDTRNCHDVIAARRAAAIIPPRKNARPWKPDTEGAVARNETLGSCNKYLGRAPWRRLTGYHRRSRAESKMNCVECLAKP